MCDSAGYLPQELSHVPQSHSNRYFFSPAGPWLSQYSHLQDVAEGGLVAFVWGKRSLGRMEEELVLGQTASKGKSSGN